MQAKETEVGKNYVTPKLKLPLQIMEHITEEGKGVVKVKVKNRLTKTEHVLVGEYDMGEAPITEEEVQKMIVEAQEKAKPKAQPVAPSSAAPKEAAQSKGEEVSSVTKKKAAAPKKAVAKKVAAPKKAKKAGEFRGRPGTGQFTRAQAIEELLYEGKYTRDQIVDKVMKNPKLELGAPSETLAKKIRAQVGVRIAMRVADGAKYEKHKETKVLSLTGGKK